MDPGGRGEKGFFLSIRRRRPPLQGRGCVGIPDKCVSSYTNQGGTAEVVFTAFVLGSLFPGIGAFLFSLDVERGFL